VEAIALIRRELDGCLGRDVHMELPRVVYCLDVLNALADFSTEGWDGWPEA
jgi:hypothetical protein